MYKSSTHHDNINLNTPNHAKEQAEEEVYDIDVNEFWTPTFRAEDLSGKKMISTRIEQVQEEDSEPEPESEGEDLVVESKEGPESETEL